MEPHRVVASQALAIIKRAGAPAASGERSLAIEQDGVRFAIALAGPDVPDDVPAAVAEPDTVSGSVLWRGDYTLKIRAPRTVFEIAWSSGEPVRIMAFSRGTWEHALQRLAEAS